MKTTSRTIKLFALAMMALLAMTGISTAQSSNADLSDQVPSDGTLNPAFASGTTVYTAMVGNATTSVTVTPTAADVNATITVNTVPVASGTPSGAISLNLGSNEITTVVTAEDAVTTKTYTLTVFRGPVIYEPFAQTSGNLNLKAASTTGLSGNWIVGAGTANIVNPDTITHGALANSGGQADLLSTGNSAARVVRKVDLATAGLLDNGKTLWFSLVFHKTADGGSNEHSGFALGSSYLNSAFNGVGLAASGNALGFYSRGSATRVLNWTGTTPLAQTSGVAGPTVPLSTPTILVGKIEWGATAGDVEKFTLYKPNLDLSALGTAFALTSVPAFDQTTLNTISFTQRNSGGTYTFDEIRFGASQADVLPADTVAPSLISMTDDKAGGPIGEDVAIITYDLTFDRHMDLASFQAADFDNAGDATTTIGTISQPSPTVIRVQVLPTTTGTVQLRIPATSVIKSLAQVDLDTTSAILDDTTITINAGTTPANTPTTNRWWDGATITGVTNGVSDGGTGTWDNGTTTNWDRGAGFEAPVAWDNTTGTGSKAFFQRTGAGVRTVSLGSDITVGEIDYRGTLNTADLLTFGDASEDNTLNFGGAAKITTNDYYVTFRSGITGAPTINYTGRQNDNSSKLTLAPAGSLTMNVGAINTIVSPINAKNCVLDLGGSSAGNTATSVTWSNVAQQLLLLKTGSGTWTLSGGWDNTPMGDSQWKVQGGTLILNGNFNISHILDVENGGTLGGTPGGITTLRVERTGANEHVRVLAGGTMAPGTASVGTINVNDKTTMAGKLKVDVSGATADLLAITGDLDLSALTDVIEVVELGAATLTDYTVVTYTGTLTGTFNTETLPLGYTVDYTTPNQIHLLYAGGATYTVTYDGNGKTSGDPPVDGATYATGATVTVLGNTGSLVKTGFVFTGWNTQTDGLGTHYNPAATFSMGSANTTLYAEWKTPYNVWAGGAAFGDDANGDGVKNGLAFLLGAANPSENAIGRLPTVTESGGGLIMTFNCLPVAARGTAILKVSHSNNLATWTTTVDVVPDADDAVPDNNVTFVVGAGPAGPPALKAVTATIDAAAAAAGKLFGRLEAEQP